jgi:hypothetical protein
MSRRQDGRVTVHFDPGTGVVCPVGKQGSDDPRATNCGRCENTAAWKRAWKAEAKRAKVPAP